MEIIATAIITFVVTVIWQKWADRKGKLPLRVLIQSMMNELNWLAQKAGYVDVTDYWIKEKGKDYAQVAMMNYQETIKFLE